MLPLEFYQRPALALAAELLGCELIHADADGAAAGIIVETEAYRADDPASHSFRGPNTRNSVMFGPAGHAYVYLSYGIHYCFNVVGGGDGGAEAVLVRALQPTHGIELMKQRRRTTDLHNLCSGPAKLVQALGITPAHNGAPLTTPQLHLRPRRGIPERIMVGPRIGITQAADKPWRFFIAKNAFVSKHKFNNVAVPLEHEPTTPR